MARPKHRKRSRGNELPQDEPPAKKTKTRGEIDIDAWASWIYPPEFWDRLSKIELSHRALEEFDRRTVTQRSPHPPPPSAQRALDHTTTHAAPKDLTRFARQGGPDLSDLRGYPEPKGRRPASIMSSSQSSRSRRTKSTDPASTQPTSATTKTKKSTPYNRDFDLHLTDHDIYATYASQEPNLDKAMAELAVPRPSLSPSKFSDGAFKIYRQNNAWAQDEDDVLANVIPTITGPSQASHPSARNTVFGNLEPITDGTIAPPKPDIYYGANPEELTRGIRNELRDHIIPSSMETKPMLPNFFVEVKGPDGSAAVATRQARYDGAFGSRAMHRLQNYGKEEPEYDGNAYTFSSIYHNGLLQMYAHHPTSSATPGGRPGYHMTPLRSFAMADNRETFVEGATVFRNARDLAKRHRDNLIDAANARLQTQIAVPLSSIEAPFEDSTSDEFVDCEDHLNPQAPTTQAADPIAALSKEPPSFPTYLYDDGDYDDNHYDDSQGPSQASVAADPGGPSMSFASSFTSRRSKRQLSPRSSVNDTGSSKRRTRQSTRPAKSTRTATSSKHKAEDGPIVVTTYQRKGKLCFKNPQGLEV